MSTKYTFRKILSMDKFILMLKDCHKTRLFKNVEIKTKS